MPRKGTPRAGSDSAVQRAAERQVLEQLSGAYGVAIAPRQLILHGRTFTVDGYAEQNTSIVLFEVWAHIGSAKSAQKHKVLADLLKRATLARLLREVDANRTVECTIVFVDEAAERMLLNRSWAALAAATFGIRTVVVPLSLDMQQAVLAAQRVQDLRSGVDEIVE